MEKDRLTALAMLSIEKEFVQQLVYFNKSILINLFLRRKKLWIFLHKHSATNSREQSVKDVGRVPIGSGTKYVIPKLASHLTFFLF